jgi:2-dehydropantoate 2-reductase
MPNADDSPEVASFSQKKPNNQPITWTIVGCGAIGLLAAARAALSGFPKVQLALRQQKTIDKVPASFAFSFCAGQQEYPILLSTISPQTPIAALLIPVKAYSIVDTVKEYLPRLSGDAQIVLCHNGMGTIEQVLPLLGEKQGLWFASTTHGAYKSTPLRVVHSGLGKTILAALNPAAKQHQAAKQITNSSNDSSVVDAMDQMLGPCELVSDIMPFLWRKLAVNLVINSLTAIHNVRNGALAGTEYQSVMNQLITEFLAVAALTGQTFDAKQLQLQIADVIARTADNYSSMLQDVTNGRKLEADYISGFLLKLGKQHLLDLPTIAQINQALHSLASVR